MDTEGESLASPDRLRGSILGGCRLEDRIGKGGMGSVYRAMHLSRRCRVAV